MLVIQVRVKPNAKVTKLVDSGDGTWIAYVKSPPVNGRANRELTGLLAKEFNCTKSAVKIRHGSSGRMKLVHIDT